VPIGVPDLVPFPDDPVEMSFLVPYYRSVKIYGELCNLNQRISMLHPDVLAILHHLAAGGLNVLELGPYTGGSTIAMAWGAKSQPDGQRVTSVEMGGSYQHASHGTDDILRDLALNLAAHGVADLVRVVPGNSRDQSVVAAVAADVPRGGYGLFFLDTDGRVADDFRIYREMLAARAYIVIDDYFAPGAPWKVGPTRQAIEDLVGTRQVVGLGVYGWGTWVGRLAS